MKKFIFFVLLLLTAALFISCGEVEKGEDTPSSSTEKKVETEAPKESETESKKTVIDDEIPVLVDGNDNIVDDPFSEMGEG